jgi:hypothetical protein
VFKVAVYDAYHGNVFTQAFYARHEHADAAYVELNLNAGTGSFVQFADYFWLCDDQRVSK